MNAEINTIAEAMTGVTTALSGAFQEMFAGIADGTMNLAQVFTNLGGSLRSLAFKIIADVMAKYLASLLAATLASVVHTVKEIGMAAAVEGFHIVQGRPFAKAVMLKALAEKDPNCEWIMITSADATQATIKTKHRQIPEVLEYQYTIERARAAGYLTGNNRANWETKPQEMLEARATSKAVRRWYPGATFGMHSVEEAHDD